MPRPRPSPFLVVKNGSPARARTSAAMPRTAILHDEPPRGGTAIDRDPHLALCAGLERVLDDAAERLRERPRGHVHDRGGRRGGIDRDRDPSASREIAEPAFHEGRERHVDERLARTLARVGRHLLEDGAATLDLLADEPRILDRRRRAGGAERTLELLGDDGDRRERGRELVRGARRERRERRELFVAGRGDAGLAELGVALGERAAARAG